MASYEEAIEFERRVATIYRALGAKVEHNISLAGNQIDVLVSEQTQSGTTLRSAVECKYFLRPVGVETVNSFAVLIILLRDRNLVDKGTLVAKSGFTNAARASGREHGIELIEIADLEHRVTGKESEMSRAEEEVRQQWVTENSPSRTPVKRAFVVMPFAAEFDDIYVLGIRETAEQLGMVVERADSIEHNQSIPEIIRRKISQCNVVIADTSQHNPNVFYEIGLAHGVSKETILICRDANTIPFDLAAINHIVYSSIVDLREKLKPRLKVTLQI